jgi:hypothetical protein
MAARIRKIRNDEEHRKRIKTTQLVKRLTLHALGKVEMQKSAVTAAIALIRKTLPDLSSTTLAGDANNPLRWEAIQRNVVDPATHKPEHVNGGPNYSKVFESNVNGGPKHTNGSGIQTAPDSEPV